MIVRTAVTMVLILFLGGSPNFAQNPPSNNDESGGGGTKEPAVIVSVIDHVNLIDVEKGIVVPDSRVILKGPRIESVGLASELEIPSKAIVIDGTGKFLIPGLFDAHVHITTSLATFPKLMIANGVTACRDTGAANQFVLPLRKSSQQPDVELPLIFATGAIIDGNPPVWPFSIVCETAEQAVAAVQKQKAAGVDQIKVYARLPAEAYRAAVAEAHRQNLKATGHVAGSVNLHVALEVGQDCIEHLDGFDRLLLEFQGLRDEEIAKLNRAERMKVWEKLDDVDSARLDAHLKLHAEKKIFHCPTLVVIDGIGRVTDESRPGTDDPRMIYVQPFLTSFWAGKYDAFSPIARRSVPGMQKMVRRMHEQGIPLVTGTDLANPYVFAGSSLHDEMVFFAQAGIPNADVLRMATLNPAILVDAQDQLGTISPGKWASLVLLDANPLDSIENVRRIDAVWNKGNHLNREALKGIHSALENKPKDP